MAQTQQALFITWQLNVQGATLEFPLIIDWFSLTFVGTVGVIAGRIFLFSQSYITAEKFFLRFHLLVFAFVLSIGLLIFSPNLVRVLLG